MANFLSEFIATQQLSTWSNLTRNMFWMNSDQREGKTDVDIFILEATFEEIILLSLLLFERAGIIVGAKPSMKSFLSWEFMQWQPLENIMDPVGSWKESWAPDAQLSAFSKQRLPPNNNFMLAPLKTIRHFQCFPTRRCTTTRGILQFLLETLMTAQAFENVNIYVLLLTTRHLKRLATRHAR